VAQQFDVNINIGLGIGSKDEQVQKLMALSQQQAHVMAIGVANPKNVYELMSDIAKGMGQKNPDKYFNDPEKNPPPRTPAAS
jgi:phosphoribosylformimino-5-aminoimidazole carboxamide ribonucleotide (ProFAR) isomerase